MTTYQATVNINATSFIGQGYVNYSVDGIDNYAADATNDYALEIHPVGSIKSLSVVFGYVRIESESSVRLSPTVVTLNAINQNYAPEDILTLWCESDDPHRQDTETDDWYATLSKFKWSDLGQGGVFKGFVITAGTGVAVLADDPQYHSDTVEVEIISPFPAWKIPVGQWKLHIPLGTDFNAKVNTPNYFRDSLLISTLMKDFRKFVVSESQYLTRRAGDLRKWDKIPPQFLGELISTLGCYLNISLLDDESRRRLAYEWKEFLLYAGTEYFIDFLAYLYDTHLSVSALWTKDYRSFVTKDQTPGDIFPPNQIIPFFADLEKPYYPTNHVLINYDPHKFDVYNEEVYNLLLDTFYKLASVPLVLQAFAARFNEPVNMVMVMVDHDQHDYTEIAPPIILPDMTLYMVMVDYRHIERSSHAPMIQMNDLYVYMVMVDYRHAEYSDFSPMIEI